MGCTGLEGKSGEEGCTGDDSSVIVSSSIRLDEGGEGADDDNDLVLILRLLTVT